MMRILRYTIPADGMPHDFRLTNRPQAVDNGVLRNEVNFWAGNDDQAEGYPARLQVVGSGEPLPDHAFWLGTTPKQYGVVWHLVQIPVPIEGVTRGMGTEEEEGVCDAEIWHGPGHQSRTKCELKGAHDVHRAIYMGTEATWRGPVAHTGAFDEPPMAD